MILSKSLECQIDEAIECDIDEVTEMKYRDDLCPFCHWPVEGWKHLDACKPIEFEEE